MLLNRTITVHRKTWADTNGTRTSTETTATMSGAAQPMKTSRVIEHGLTAGQTGWTVYTRQDPTVNALDTIVVGTHTLQVLAPARDEGGRSMVWGVDCMELV